MQSLVPAGGSSGSLHGPQTTTITYCVPLNRHPSAYCHHSSMDETRSNGSLSILTDANNISAKQ